MDAKEILKILVNELDGDDYRCSDDTNIGLSILVSNSYHKLTLGDLRTASQPEDSADKNR